MSKSVAKKEEAKLPATGYDYGQDAGAGFEGTTSKDLSIPFLMVLQANSPQVEENDPEGSKPGMLYDSVTKELYDGEEGLVFIPCYKDVKFVEWIPRDNGGGFVGIHAMDSDVAAQAIAANGGERFGKLKAGENDLIETHYVYGLVLDKEGKSVDGFAVLSFSSTKIKPCRDWLTSMYKLKGRPPLFANRAVIRTKKQKNEKGTFFNFRIDPFNGSWAGGLISPADEADLLQEAKDFKAMVESGIAKADFSQQNAAGDETAAEGGEAAPF